MFENIEGNISKELEYLPITLFSNKLKIGIIGGGKGALIKVRTFLKRGCYVEVVSPKFTEEMLELKSDRLNLINDVYHKAFISDKHLIVVAIDDVKAINDIIEHCNLLSKIYINSTSHRDGMGVIPVARESKNISIAVNTKVGNPKASVLVANYLMDEIKEVDSFIEFTALVRNNIDMESEVRKNLLEFINTEDFRCFYNKNKHIKVLRLFYKESLVKKIENCNVKGDEYGTDIGYKKE